ncbi:unnamed protein product [Rotaria sp. Silwood2]|nr:unnamed protein product [Rotaria sp. Silwood2]
METQAMMIADKFENDKQQINSTDNILQLYDYLSLYRKDGREINFLNLDRCLRQPYIINDISNNESIDGVSVTHNYLIQIPPFVSNYTNLIELNDGLIMFADYRVPQVLSYEGILIYSL